MSKLFCFDEVYFGTVNGVSLAEKRIFGTSYHVVAFGFVSWFVFVFSHSI